MDGHDPIIAIFAGLLGAALAAAIVFNGAPAHSQDRPGDYGFHHHESHDWYKNLHNHAGFPCCNGDSEGVAGDCRPTRAELKPDGHWRARIDGEWRDIPPEVEIDPKLNRDPLHAHVCASKAGVIYCFIGAGDGG